MQEDQSPSKGWEAGLRVAEAVRISLRSKPKECSSGACPPSKVPIMAMLLSNLVILPGPFVRHLICFDGWSSQAVLFFDGTVFPMSADAIFLSCP